MASKYLKICFITLVRVIPPCQSGMANLIIDLSCALSELGIDVTIVTPAPHPEISDRREIKVNEHVRIFVSPYRLPHYNNLYSRTLKAGLSMIKSVVMLDRKYGFDIIHSHSQTLPASWIGAFLKIFLRKPAIHTLHGVSGPKLKPKRLSKYLFSIFDEVLATTYEQYRLIKDFIPNLKILHDGIMPQRFYPLTEEERVKVRKNSGIYNKTVGFIGPLVRARGFHNFLRISRELINENPNVTFLIMNSSPGKSMKNDINDIKDIKDHFVFTGYIENRNEIINCMDVVVFPFDYIGGTLGQPLALLEAMACGKTVIATNVECVNEIIEHDVNGILCPRYDINDLKNQVMRLLLSNNEREVIGASARASILKKYDINPIANQLYELYEGLHKRKGGQMVERHYSETLYSKIADTYDATRWQGKGKFIDALQKKLLYRILEEENIAVGNSILDIGAGTGRFVLPLREAGYAMYGIDISERMIKIAKSKAKGETFNLITANAKAIPFKNSTFNCVISYRTLIHIPAYKGVFMEISRVLKPGGIAILEFNNKFSISTLGKAYRGLRRILKASGAFSGPQVVSYSELHKSCLGTDLKIEKIHHQFFISEVFLRNSPAKSLNILERIDTQLSKCWLTKLFATRLIVVVRKMSSATQSGKSNTSRRRVFEAQ